MPPTSDRAVRMQDVAARAGVSRMAASAVLMGTGKGRIRVSTSTASNIRRAAEELGYRPNKAAQQLAGKSSGVLALVVKDVRNFLAQKVLSELHMHGEADGLRMMTVNAYPGLEALERVLQDAKAGWIDGIVYLANENEKQWPEVAALLRQHPQSVVVMGDIRAPGVASIVSDVETGARQTIEHLLERGCRKFALLTEEYSSRAIRRRVKTYRESLAGHGLKLDRSQIYVETADWRLLAPETADKFDELALRILKQQDADAILCDDDFNAIGLLTALRRLKIDVPGQVAITGWGDLPMTGLFDPPFTTVADDLSTILAAAVKAASGRKLEESVQYVPTRLVIRQTS